MTKEKEPFVSFVIPCRNEKEDIADAVNSLLKQDYSKERYEIIVVDGGSTDGTNEILEKYGKKIKIEREKGRMGPANARNQGARIARGEIIAFMDADTVFNKGYLRNTARHFGNKNVDAVSTKTEDYKKPGRKPSFVAQCYFAERRAAGHAKKDTGIHLIRKKTFFQLGGFNERLGAAEDVDLERRFSEKGLECEFEGNSISSHKEPKTLTEVFREARWWGRTNLNLMKESPKIFFAKIAGLGYRTIMPLVFMFALLTSNAMLLAISVLWILENLFLVWKAVKRTGYLSASICLPVFKTLRYYMLVFWMFYWMFSGRKEMTQGK